MPAFDAERPWALAPQVALRPEPFGALAYHFGTRRLSFLKRPELVSLVRSLERHASAHDALLASGMSASHQRAYGTALARLASTGMIVPRDAA